jgi:pimeloyl-ACP methyl ester carboxylesterase
MLLSRRIRPLTTLVFAVLAGWGVSAGGGRPAWAAEVKLKNGMVLTGAIKEIETLVIGPRKGDSGPITIYPILVIFSPLKRYYIPNRPNDFTQNKDVDLSKHGGFKLHQDGRPGRSKIVASVQGYARKPGPFDPFGRRNVFLETASGEMAIIQGVTQITPEYLKVVGLNATWETALATNSVPLDELDAMLRRQSDEDNPDDRLKIARFYIQAELYAPAHRELEAIRYKFPELADTIRQVEITLIQAEAQEVLSELKRRRLGGQHQFVFDTTRNFPAANVAAPILREVREIADEYERAREQKERAVSEWGELQAELKDDKRVSEIAPLRAELAEKVTYSSMGRLDAYFKLSGDPLLRPEEKLSLALSGWIVGSENSTTEIDQTLRLWQARFLLMDYLQSAPDADLDRRTIRERLDTLEGVGPERIAQMIPLLPPPLDTVGAVPGRATRIQVARGKDEHPAAYWVSLPYEYHPDHSYPLIVALHSEAGTPQQELQGFWGGTEERGGQSQRHGYIVIAPEFIGKADTKGYEYNSGAHQIVIDSIRDARHRFSIDSDRVFLSGHGMGGEAAWDMGLAHPHLFAGVIPINGAIDRHSKYYMDNGRQLPLYPVNGELDRDLVTRNAASLMHMMQHHFDLIYTEYTGAGPDPFHSEIHALFEWMGLQTRPSPPKQITIKTLRETDNRFYWLEFSGIPDNLKGIDWSSNARAPRAMSVTANITQGNTLRVASGAAHYRFWLARGEGLVDFDKRLKVEINGRNKWNDFVKPDVGAMLEHVRLTGDRQQLYWAVLEF